MNRKEMLKMSGMVGLSAILTPSLLRGDKSSNDIEKLKIIVAGAHPDDPETGCGGTIKLLTNAGHKVIIYYLTKGQAGIEGLSYKDTLHIRMEEAKKACKILGAKAVFGNQVDGKTEINKDRYEEVLQFIENQKPDIVFTHWPIDTHSDHRACANLFYNTWLNSSKGFELYYFEVLFGHQTQNFNPTIYIDISNVINSKHKACFVHKSQKIKDNYENDHGLMEKFRGMQLYGKNAEAFIQQLPYNKHFL